MKNFLRLLILLKPFIWQVLLSVLLGCATLFAGIGLLGTSAYLIASAALRPSIAELQVAIVGVRFFGLSRGIFRYLERLVSHSVNLNILTRLRTSFYERIEPGAPLNLVSFRSGDLLNRVMGDLETIENFYVRFFAPVVVAILAIIGVSLFVGGYIVELGIIIASGLSINAFVIPFIVFVRTRQTNADLVHARSALSAGSVEVLQGLTDLQAFNMQEHWFGRIRLSVKRTGMLQARNLFWNSLGNSFSLMIMNLTVIVLLVTAIPIIRGGMLDGVSLAVITLIALASFEATSALPNAAVVFSNSLESMDHLFEVGGRSEDSHPNRDQVMRACPNVIELKDVSFRYQGEEKETIKNLSFQIERGKSIGLTGISGAGKTTLLNLLIGFLEPQSGKILFDGVNSRGLNIDHVRKCFGVISQQPYLFNENLSTNLLMANPEATNFHMIDALTSVGLDDWFKSLPNGVDTWIGEHGIKLSAGERQRLAIARLILQDPPFILLDELSANLDPLTEEKLISGLFSRFKDKGILMVTHRLELLSYVDDVLILQNSRIIEHGGFVELAEKAGVFKSMLDLSRNNLV